MNASTWREIPLILIIIIVFPLLNLTKKLKCSLVHKRNPDGFRRKIPPNIIRAFELYRVNELFKLTLTPTYSNYNY